MNRNPKKRESAGFSIDISLKLELKRQADERKMTYSSYVEDILRKASEEYERNKEALKEAAAKKNKSLAQIVNELEEKKTEARDDFIKKSEQWSAIHETSTATKSTMAYIRHDFPDGEKWERNNSDEQ